MSSDYPHPLKFDNPCPIQTVLTDMAGQEGHDGEPWDVMQAASDYIRDIHQQLAAKEQELAELRDALTVTQDLAEHRLAALRSAMKTNENIAELRRDRELLDFADELHNEWSFYDRNGYRRRYEGTLRQALRQAIRHSQENGEGEG